MLYVIETVHCDGRSYSIHDEERQLSSNQRRVGIIDTDVGSGDFINSVAEEPFAENKEEMQNYVKRLKWDIYDKIEKLQYDLDHSMIGEVIHYE
jgi:hypothetical protein